MKACELRGSFGIESLAITERPEPTPGAGQVLVKLRAWSLNYRDLMMVKGLYNPKLRLPFTPLSDGVGDVVAVGEGVTRIKPGVRVAGIFMQKWIDGELTEAKAKSALGGAIEGLLAEYAVLSEEGVVPVPEHLTDEEAATLPCAAVTAWHALVTKGGIKAGDTVLTQGTGGVALFALQFARLMGARADRCLGRGSRRRGRRRRHARGIAARGSDGRPHQLDRGPFGGWPSQPDAHAHEKCVRPGDLRRQPSHVRGHEQGHRFPPHAAGRGPHIPVWRDPRGFPLHGERRALWQDRPARLIWGSTARVSVARAGNQGARRSFSPNEGGPSMEVSIFCLSGFISLGVSQLGHHPLASMVHCQKAFFS